MAKHNETGRIGEDIAEKYLKRKGFEIVERNYRKPYGEIDIVARERGGKLHFVEVKTVSWETLYRPEDNLTPWKLKKLSRAFQVYLSHPPDHRAGETGEWQFDVLCVYLDEVGKRAKVKLIPNIVIGT
jgi:putative endonuclease